MNGISADNFPFAMPILTYVRWHDAAYCSPQDCAGRSLPPAEARNGIRIVAFPAGHGPKTFHYDVCGSLSRAVRRQLVHVRPPPANSKLRPENIRKAPAAAEDKFCTQSILGERQVAHEERGIPRGKMQGNLLLHSLIVIFAP